MLVSETSNERQMAEGKHNAQVITFNILYVYLYKPNDIYQINERIVYKRENILWLFFAVFM